jgi:DHA1 family multidrug resistance protein-like MFS transporter
MALSDPPAAHAPVWRRRNVLNLLVIALFAELGLAVLNVSTMPIYLSKTRGLGEFNASLVLVAFLLSEALFKGPMGHLADHVGRKALMTLAPLLTVLTAITSVFVPHGLGSLEVLIFVLLRIIDGIGAAMFWPAAYAASGDVVADDERQQAMSLLNACYFIGLAFALPIGGAIEDLFREEASLFLAAGVFFFVAVAVFILMPSDGRGKHTEHEEPSEFNLLQFFATARQIPQYLLLSAVTFCGIGFPGAIIKLFAIDEFGMTPSQFGSFIVLPGAIAMVVLSVPMSKLGERLGRARAVHLGMGLCAGGVWFIALGAFFPFLRHPLLAALGGIPIGVGFLLAIPAWMASVSDLNPRRRAANLGAVMTAQGLGAIIGVPLGGLMYDKLTTVGRSFAHYSPFIGCATCVTIGWLIGLRILRPHEQA